MEPIKFTSHLSIKDAKRAYFEAYLRTASFKGTVIILAAIYVVSLLTAVTVTWVGAILFLIIFAFIGYFITKARIGLAVRSNKVILEPKQWEIGEEYIIQTGNSYELKNKLSSVVKISETTKCFFIWYDKYFPTVIPKDHISNEEQRRLKNLLSTVPK